MKTLQDPEAAETAQTKEIPAVAPAATCSALVRRCDVCGIINACDIDATPARWKELQLPDHTVMRVTEAEAMELWKNAGRCDHKKYIEELRAKIHTQNARAMPPGAIETPLK